MTTIKAHFDGKAFIPHDRVDLAVDQEVTLLFEVPSDPPLVQTEQELLELFNEMDADAASPDHPVDYSRDSIYDGTVDDPH